MQENWTVGVVRVDSMEVWISKRSKEPNEWSLFPSLSNCSKRGRGCSQLPPSYSFISPTQIHRPPNLGIFRNPKKMNPYDSRYSDASSFRGRRRYVCLLILLLFSCFCLQFVERKPTRFYCFLLIVISLDLFRRRLSSAATARFPTASLDPTGSDPHPLLRSHPLCLLPEALM